MDHQAGFLAAVSTLEHVHSPEGSSDEVKSHCEIGWCKEQPVDVSHCCEFKLSSLNTKLIVHLPGYCILNIIFLVSCGAAFMANILMLPYLTMLQCYDSISSTLVVDFVGLVLMGACYVCHTH